MGEVKNATVFSCDRAGCNTKPEVVGHSPALVPMGWFMVEWNRSTPLVQKKARSALCSLDCLRAWVAGQAPNA